MSGSVAAKDSVSGSLFGEGQELWAGCWGCSWAPQPPARSAEGPTLPLLAELLPEVTVDRKLNVPGTLSSHHILVSPSLRFPHLQNSPGVHRTPFLCPVTLLVPGAQPGWSLCSSWEAVMEGEGPEVLLKNLDVSPKSSLWLFCVCPVPRSTMRGCRASGNGVSISSVFELLICLSLQTTKLSSPPSHCHIPPLCLCWEEFFSLHLRHGEHLQRTALLKAGTSPLHQCQSSCWEWHCGSLEPSSIPGKDLTSLSILSLMLSLISYHKSCPCSWWN